MGCVHRVAVLGVRAELVEPGDVGVRDGQLDAAVDLVDDECEELLLVARPPVHGGHAHAELGRDLAHAERIEPSGTEQLERRLDDTLG